MPKVRRNDGIGMAISGALLRNWLRALRRSVLMVLLFFGNNVQSLFVPGQGTLLLVLAVLPMSGRLAVLLVGIVTRRCPRGSAFVDHSSHFAVTKTAAARLQLRLRMLYGMGYHDSWLVSVVAMERVKIVFDPVFLSRKRQTTKSWTVQVIVSIV